MWPFVLLSTPAVVWAIVALANGYTLEGDNAHIALRTFDVFSSNPPLLGMPSTAGNEVSGAEVFHPGSLHFLLLAPLYAISGFTALGMTLASLTVNLGLMAIGLWVAWRIDLPWVKYAVVCSFAFVVVFSQGVLYTPWNPYPVHVGVITLIVLAWGIACGLRGLWPIAVVVASLVAQAHLAGLIVVPAVTLFTVGVIFWLRWAARPRVWEVLATIVVLALCWALPLRDLIVNWPGNPGAIVGYATGSQGATGSRSDSASAGQPDLGALVFALVLGVLSYRGFRRSTSALNRQGDSPQIRHATVLAVGLFLASSVTLVSALAFLIIDSSRGPYLLMFVGGWVLQFLLLKPRATLWWESWSKTTSVVAAILVLAMMMSFSQGNGRMRDGTQNHEVVLQARDLLSQHPEWPVVVEQHGQVVWQTSGMAVVTDLIVHGRTVFYDHFTDRADYDEQRRISQAPADHLTLHVIQQNADKSWPELNDEAVLDMREVRLTRSDANIRLVLTQRGD